MFFCRAIDDFEFFHPVVVIIGKQELVGRMNLDHPNAHAQDGIHVSLHVGTMARMHSATRNKPLRIFLAIIDRPLIDFAGQAHDLRSNIVNEHGPVHSNRIEVFEQRFG